MFTNVYYDEYHGRMHLWELSEDSGRVVHSSIPHDIEYYVEDKTNTSNIKDVYGTRVVKKVSESRKSLKALRQSKVKTFESDLPEEVKFLHNRYGDRDIKPDPKNYKVANIDIEIQCSNEFPKPELAKYPINLITIDFYRTDEIVTLGLNEYNGEYLNRPGFKYIHCKNEEILLSRFCDIIRKERVQIITGWNCLHENSTVWLKDRIRSIKTLSNCDETSSDGIITDVVCTGSKETKKITLMHGSDIISTNSHIFPIVSTLKDKYHNHNLNDRFVNTRVGNFPSLDTHNIYLKVEFGNNTNTDYTYRQYLLDNIDFVKDHPFFNCFIPDRIIKKYLSDKELKRWTRNSKHFMYREVKISDIDLIDIITNDDVFGYSYRNVITNIQLSDSINYDMCRLIGLIYTDGTRSDTGYAFYNNDKRLIWDTRNICRTNDLLKSKMRPYGKYGQKICGRLKFGNNNAFTLLSIAFYGYDKKKSLNLDIFSRFSKEQFKYVFSGMVDGDGWVTDNESIGFCNYNGNDIEKIHELLLWNGVFVSRSKNRIGIKTISVNQDFVSTLPLRQRQKVKSQKTLKYRTPKNKYSNKLNFLFYDGYALVRVKSIENCGFNTCYDITTESHLFTTNAGIKTHNCSNFDIPYICNRIENLNLEDVSLSPLGKVHKKRDGTFIIPGLSILDLMELYKKFSYQNQSSYSLNYIGLQEVGEGKLDFEGQINDLWSRDWELYVNYNIQDCFLVRKIENKRKFIDLVINLCTQTRTPFERVYSTIAIVEGYMLRYLHRDNMIFPDLPIKDFSIEDIVEETIEGGYVESHPGFYNFLASIDATSEYPTLIRMLNISPETKVWNPSEEDIIRLNLIKAHTPGMYYKRTQGVIPKIVTDIFNERKMYKSMMEKAIADGDKKAEEYYDSQQMIRKILINSIYGALANKYFHFYDLDNAAEVTLGGRTVIQYIANCSNTYFSKTFPKIAKNWYPNTDIKVGDVPDRIVKIIDTDSVVGTSVINTSIGNISIEDLYTNHSSDYKETSKDNFIARVDDIKSLSLNTNTGNIEYGKVLYIKKHLVKKRMFGVKVNGKMVKITEDHSIIVKRNSMYVSISAKDIISGDKVVYVN